MMRIRMTMAMGGIKTLDLPKMAKTRWLTGNTKWITLPRVSKHPAMDV